MEITCGNSFLLFSLNSKQRAYSDGLVYRRQRFCVRRKETKKRAAKTLPTKVIPTAALRRGGRDDDHGGLLRGCYAKMRCKGVTPIRVRQGVRQSMYLRRRIRMPFTSG
jgi:hypothetical protein